MPHWQSSMPFGQLEYGPLPPRNRPPGCKPSFLPPSGHWPPSPPPSGSWPQHPSHPGSRPPSPPLLDSCSPCVPPTCSWPPISSSPEFWPSHPPSLRSWTPGPQPLGGWSPCPPPLLRSWPPFQPTPEHWPQGPPPLGSWSQGPPPMGSMPINPSSFESWPCPPYSGSWELGPPSLGSWPRSPPVPRSWLPFPPPPENWLHGAPPLSYMQSVSSSGPPCPAFMPSGCPLGSIPFIRPPETINLAPKMEEKEKPLTKLGRNDRTKPYDSEEIKSTLVPGDSSSSGKQPANKDPPKLTLNQDDKAKSLTKHGSNNGTKSDAFDEVKPPTKSREYSNLGTPLANTGPLNQVQNSDVPEKLSNKPSENVKTEYPTKRGISFEVKPPTIFSDSSNSVASPASKNPLERELNLEDKGKTSTRHGGINETKSPTKYDGFDEVKPITKPGGSITYGMPLDNIDLSVLASNPNDKEKISDELGDKPKLGGSDEVKPPTKPGGYDNSGMSPTNTDPSKLAPKPYYKEKSVTILDGKDQTKSSTMLDGSNEVKSLTNVGSKDETKPPTKLGGSDKPKPLHWFLIRKSSQGK
ncbi:unnamed protein product [Eruca vesicaria subsp. sativa]|uniref:Uncharacterized protein n=1 Tax=Eruca vesicaria subsp. sativa TaxID=29727 RepID=A0ABC8IVA3_ERUVS|nr:unnamed protein product [Eruca vesicaria subsp. sativa]